MNDVVIWQKSITSPFLFLILAELGDSLYYLYITPDLIWFSAFTSSLYSQPHSMHFTSNSLSNPDLLRDNSTTTTPHLDGSDAKSEYPEHVLKVYKSDQVRNIY